MVPEIAVPAPTKSVDARTTRLDWTSHPSTVLDLSRAATLGLRPPWTGLRLRAPQSSAIQPILTTEHTYMRSLRDILDDCENQLDGLNHDMSIIRSKIDEFDNVTTTKEAKKALQQVLSYLETLIDHNQE